MDNHTFTADVRPGGLTEGLEIKILICYLLHHIHRGMSFAEINEVFRSKGIANYFEYSQEISRLLSSGHIAARKDLDGAERFFVTDLGVKTSTTFEKDVPAAIRETTLKAAQDYYLRQQIERDNEFIVERVSDGYKVTMCIADIGSDLMSLTLFLPKEEDCEQVRERFYSDPASLYRGVIALLTGDDNTVRDILEHAAER
ncbi:MAG: DUF4364 family protein [Clostridiales bacterium]|nr:DUF4364 family protein [Clostridiales bacterium]